MIDLRLAKRHVLSRTSHALLLSAAASLALLLILVAGNDTIVQAQTPGTPTPETTRGSGDWSGVENLAPLEGERKPAAYPYMDSNLNRIVEQVQTGQFTAQAAAANAPLSSDESVAVTIYVTEGSAVAIVAFLESNGASPRNVGTDYIEAYVPVSLLPAASQREGVTSIRTIIPPQPAQGMIVSEGVAAHGVPAWHAAGLKGQEVKIGVIDVGFKGFAELMGSELPSTVQARCYTDIGVFTSNLADCIPTDIPESAKLHGTAVTEAVFDIAPEAEYYIANTSSWGDLRDTVDWMIEHDVDVINMSLGWTFSGPGDGTTPFTYSPLRSVDAAVAGGITWVNSAGNSARSNWFGPFADSNANGFHAFSATGDECNGVRIELEPLDGFTAQLRWEDAWGGASSDLDLYLISLSGNTFSLSDAVAKSEEVQEGGADDDPFELISLEYGDIPDGVYCFAVNRYKGPAPDWIQLLVWGAASTLQHYTPDHSITNPAESTNPGLLAVGATGRNGSIANPFDTTIIEPFSSQGPTIDDRTKPDIVGADAGQSVTYRSDRNPNGYFFGTSQASPHVAGLAALVEQNYPNYTPRQIANYLKSHAEDRGATGADNVWGHGFARLLASDVATPTPEPTQEPTATPEPTTTPPADSCVETLSAGGTVSGSWSSDCASEGRNGSYASYYTFTLAEFAEITITTDSSVDTYLYLREGAGRDGTVLHENDDVVSGNFNSQIRETLSEGMYTIEVTTYESGATGDFTLTVSRLPAAVDPTPTPEPTPEPSPTTTPTPTPTPPVDSCVENINADGAVSGSWDTDCASESRDGSYASYYTFTLSESVEITITTESSVDTYLYLREGAGRGGAVLHENDDIVSGNTNSQIRGTLPAGAYTIEVTTYDSGATGDFTLTVSGLSATGEPTPTPEPTPSPVPTPTPSPDGPSVVVSAGPHHACSLNSVGEISCQGVDDSGQVSERPTSSGFVAISVGTGHSCAIDGSGYVECWGSDDSGQVSGHPTAGGFTAVSTGDKHSCAIDGNGNVECWGSDEYGQSAAPSHGRFVSIGSGDNYTCGLRSDDLLECWGRFEAIDGSASTPTATPIPTATPSPVYSAETDRAALVSLYNATSGPIWKNNANWTSDAPLNSWYGVSTDSSGRVTVLILEGNGLTGILPSELATLNRLRNIRLGFNELSGTIPSELGNLSDLHALTLNDNSLSGTIPRELGRLQNLQDLTLGHNNLTGTIPRELGNLDRLVKLSIGSNQLDGEIPGELGKLVQLRELVLGYNKLTGDIPVDLGKLVNLHELVVDTNQLTGQVPPEMGDLTKLQRLWIHRNQLTGRLPATLTALEVLDSFFFESNHGLCAPQDAAFQTWLESIDEVVGLTCTSQSDSERVIFEGGIDLGIAYIERLPRYQRYKVTYSDNGPCRYPFEEFRGPVLCPGQGELKRWPEVGENIDLIAHVWNFGDTETGPFEYVWNIDGVTAVMRRHEGLASGEHVELSFEMDWPDGNQNPKVTINLDPANAIDELLENNNSLDDWVKGFTISFYFSPVSYESLTFSNRPGEAIQSPEHWVHDNVHRLNELLSEAGLEDRIRSELFEVTRNRHLWSGHPLQWDMDGWWPVWDNLPHPSIFDLDGYRDRPEIDYGLLHELLHQLGVIDLYRMYTGPETVLLPDANRPGLQAGCGTDYWNHDWECFRFTGDLFDIMAAGPNFIGNHTAGGLKSNAGHRRGFYGEYLYDTPDSTFIRIVDENPNDLPDVTLRFYQLELQEDGHIVDAIPEFVLTTDDSGQATLPNRGITGIVTTTGHQLKPNPFGMIDPVGTNGLFLIEMESPECINYEWLTVVDLNLAYWNGHTETATFEKTHRCPPVYPNAQSRALSPSTLPEDTGQYISKPPEFVPHTFWLLEPVPESP